MTGLTVRVWLSVAGAAAAALIGDWVVLAALAGAALACLFIWGAGLRGAIRALLLGAYLVLLAGGLTLASRALAGPLTWDASLPALTLSLRLLALFLFAGLLAGAGPRGATVLVPGRLGRRLRTRLEKIFDGYVVGLAEGRELLTDGWRAYRGRGRLSAYLRTLLAAVDAGAVARGEEAACAGEPETEA
ncbi:MAG: hypothetical protein A2Y64_03095 [Candidatus Coatesbacteria bacterium RBG_13_66_14]|uniref:Uncharacterized protein n=1 Tax=Candidatus Coatesbacteria bacterium RBG_13_66_14 TaxID=1817816 RepID=A0A1F5EYJ6_9BACT|nr:MAG: hypothetical protein A2Y64_03095 [Candidatus Coatesbacteria bacterium RBG_13_66_14]